MHYFSRRTRRRIVTALGSALLVLLGLAAGMGIRPRQESATWPFPETLLSATATDSTDNFVVATGLIDTNLEGVFFLDTISGDLQCTVFNPRSASFNALFKRNVTSDLLLEQDKRPKFLLVTGQISLGRFQGLPGQTAGCVAYVVEANSGRFAAYAVPWRTDLFSRGQPQISELFLLQKGEVRTAVVREQ